MNGMLQAAIRLPWMVLAACATDFGFGTKPNAQ